MSYAEEPTPHASGFRGETNVETAGHSDVLREVSEKQLLAAMPRAVQVSVSIPRDYYRAIAARRKMQGEQNAARLDLGAIEEEVLAKVERTVARLIPANSPHEAISVTTVDRLPNESPEPTFTATEQFLVLAQRHGGSCALGLFAVWALWMLTRLSSQPARTIEQPPFPEPAPVSHDIPSTEPPKSKPRVPEPISTSSFLCDDIRNLAESDPATAASVLSRWLAEANA